MKTLAAGAVSALALMLPVALPAQAQDAVLTSREAFAATTLSIAAFGEVKTAPDMATITLGVQTEAPTAAAALADNSQRMTRLMAALRQAGVAEKDIQTTGLSLNPQYVYEERKPPRLTGYQAVNNVTVTVRDLPRLGRTIDATVQAGGNQINGIGFGLSDPSPMQDEARRAAVKDLQRKAQLYAEAGGLRVGRLVNLSEGSAYVPRPPMPMFRQAVMAEAQSATPTAPGELTVRIDITGVYELTR